MWRRWVFMLLAGIILAGCTADGSLAPPWRDDSRMPSWRRISPDALTPPPRHPAPEDSGRA